jgi:hypothetical protein
MELDSYTCELCIKQREKKTLCPLFLVLVMLLCKKLLHANWSGDTNMASTSDSNIVYQTIVGCAV